VIEHFNVLSIESPPLSVAILSYTECYEFYPRIEEQHKAKTTVVQLTNTCSNPKTVVVKFSDTVAAQFAVFSSIWHHQLTFFAKSSFWHDYFFNTTHALDFF
jgi:hypothetical protein